MSGLLDKEGVIKLPPTFKDVFKKTSIKSIEYEFNSTKSSLFRDDKYHAVKIRFGVGESTSSQEFYANDMNELVKTAENFINNLK